MTPGPGAEAFQHPEPMEPEGAFALARRLVREAERILVLTGAGVSAESGVPTFRGPEGLWKHHRPEDLATIAAFRRDPRLVWEWYGWRRDRVAGCSPNPGHRALARLALSRPHVTIVTQNVDGLHEVAADQEAGASGDPTPAHPLELHGSLFRVRCTGCPERYRHREEVDAASLRSLPRCRTCGSLLRPDVVWFGERLEPTLLERAFRVARSADLCIVVGTSAVVQPAARLPLETLDTGGALIEVNTQETPLSDLAEALVRGPSARLLPRLLEEG